jgi:hypothetical protein
VNFPADSKNNDELFNDYNRYTALCPDKQEASNTITNFAPVPNWKPADESRDSRASR